jgi:hypothetical protein
MAVKATNPTDGKGEVNQLAVCFRCVDNFCTCDGTPEASLGHAVSNECMSGSPLKVLHRALCWLVVILEVFFGLLILVLLGTTQVYAHIPIDVALTLVLGFAPILTACLATRNPKKASCVALWLTPFAAVFRYRLPVYSFYLPFPLIVAMATTLLPGLFWLVAARRNWPLPLSKELFPGRPFRNQAVVIGLAFVFLATSVAVSLMLPWWPAVGDCGGGSLLDENGKPRAVDFTARILFVGPKTFHTYSLFSLARVEERFSDSIWAVPRLIILRGFFRSTDRGEDFFVEGQRSSGPFTRFLPVIERVECGHTCRVSDGAANFALRTLRDGPPRSGVRIIGTVFRSREDDVKPSPGITVLIKGPAGNTVAVTDGDGVYDVYGLPFGQYTVELSTKDWHPVCALNLEARPVDGCSLFLDEVINKGNQED